MSIAEEMKANLDIVSELEARGVFLKGNGQERIGKCPFHEDGSPSFSVNTDKQVWKCHAGCGGGSVIDLIAKFEGKDPRQMLREANPSANDPKTPWRANSASKKAIPDRLEEEKIYPYHDSMGREVYQVVRYKPKTFRQRHLAEDGSWKWSMDGVTRVLYRLPKIIAAQEVWVVEGEKDADALVDCGFEATCNVGGAGKWLDSYTDSLADKDVVVCGDNDKAGEEHAQKVMDSLAGKVRSLRRVKAPSPHKDAADFVASFRGGLLQASDALAKLRDQAELLVKGLDLPLKGLAEMEGAYQRFVAKSVESPLDLGLWLPSLRKCARRLVPGDLVTVLAGTGVGKTAILQNICLAFATTPTVFFQMELSEEAMFERMVAFKTKWTGEAIEHGYEKGSAIGPEALGRMFPKLLICNRSGLSLPVVEKYVDKAELKLGERPRLVLLDYVQLIQGSGDSRYERFSQIAEDARQLANRLGVTIVMTSQIKRKSEDSAPEVTKTDAKESGSIENSSSLLLGAWRTTDEFGNDTMFVRVIKNSRGTVGVTIECNWDGSMRISERSPVKT